MVKDYEVPSWFASDEPVVTFVAGGALLGLVTGVVITSPIHRHLEDVSSDIDSAQLRVTGLKEAEHIFPTQPQARQAIEAKVQTEQQAISGLRTEANHLEHVKNVETAESAVAGLLGGLIIWGVLRVKYREARRAAKQRRQSSPVNY